MPIPFWLLAAGGGIALEIRAKNTRKTPVAKITLSSAEISTLTAGALRQTGITNTIGFFAPGPTPAEISQGASLYGQAKRRFFANELAFMAQMARAYVKGQAWLGFGPAAIFGAIKTLVQDVLTLNFANLPSAAIKFVDEIEWIQAKAGNQDTTLSVDPQGILAPGPIFSLTASGLTAFGQPVYSGAAYGNGIHPDAVGNGASRAVLSDLEGWVAGLSGKYTQAQVRAAINSARTAYLQGDGQNDYAVFCASVYQARQTPLGTNWELIIDTGEAIFGSDGGTLYNQGPGYVGPDDPDGYIPGWGWPLTQMVPQRVVDALPVTLGIKPALAKIKTHNGPVYWYELAPLTIAMGYAWG